MVMTFRVSELMTLLQYAGKNKHGRKQELQQRAVELARSRATPIHMKIRELYQTINAQSGLPMTSVGSSAVAPTTPVTGSFPGSNYSAPNFSQHVLQGRRSYNQQFSKTDQQQQQQAASKQAVVPAEVTSFPTHPDVQFKQLPFFDILAELVKPTCLAPTSTCRGYNELQSTFHLSPQQADLIASNHDTRVGVKIEFPVQVQVRFCLLETSCAQEDHFPPSLIVRMNGRTCQLPNPIPSTKQGVEPKRPPRPVNVTAQCRISPVVANTLNVSWTPELSRAYCVTVALVRRLTAHDLVSRLKARGVKSADFTRALIKEKLSEGVDDEIATTSLKCSLQCPLGKCRMLLPCRANTCTHLQCFDATLFIQMNERKPTWVCPVCDKSCLYSHLLIDGYFTEMLKNTSSSTMDVRLDMDGSWVDLSRAAVDTKQPLEDSGSSVTVETLEDDSGSDEIKVTAEKLAAPAAASSSARPSAATALAAAAISPAGTCVLNASSPAEVTVVVRTEPECIDLISDDEDSSPTAPTALSTDTTATNGGDASKHNGAWQATPVGETRLKLTFSSSVNTGGINTFSSTGLGSSIGGGSSVSTVHSITAPLSAPVPCTVSGFYSSTASALPYLGLSSINSALATTSPLATTPWSQPYGASVQGSLLSPSRLSALHPASVSSSSVPPLSIIPRPAPAESPDVISLD